MIDLYLVRHGESEANLSNRIAGHLDTPLSEKWQQQAVCLKKYLLDAWYDFDEIYSSPLQRAYNTIVAYAKEKNKEIITDDRLKEKYLWPQEGALKSEVFWDGYHEDPYYFESGKSYESYETLTQKVEWFLREEIFSKTRKSVLVSCHAGVTRSFVAALTWITRETAHLQVQNASLTHYQIDENSLEATCEKFSYDVYLREQGLI